MVQICLNQKFGAEQATGHSWWRHQMETFSAQLALCAGNSPVPVNSPHRGQWRGALMFTLICVWINGWVNNREAGDLRRYRGHYDVTVMPCANDDPDRPEWVIYIYFFHVTIGLGIKIILTPHPPPYFLKTGMIHIIEIPESLLLHDKNVFTLHSQYCSWLKI